MSNFFKTDKYTPCDPERFLVIEVKSSFSQMEMIIDLKNLIVYERENHLLKAEKNRKKDLGLIE